ncbi:hypothetical protein PPYR_02666 [Photinus pyralis]|uniref:HTH psq-type domain-containing protein n=1 Tax=Photinus pyralis TaxID=7054 RepID=A0A5N4B0F4_PHOPY|nr:tigger transposable element-derived protein 6-like [Photinus pyralis]XP_031329631.1 tigger transposable element-derived protein 6-like [Photinus pyralis]KAB0803072.1 hypothetical protein PPYR_00042 [Photinus pyralis]KAB0805696.1 hypothetical protein PPYR_02666 [Photinus pyralis]
MPRKYLRTSTKASWSSENMNAALKAISDGASVRQVSIRFGIPRSTLQDRMKKGDNSRAVLGRKSVFSVNAEKELVTEIIRLSKIFYGLTSQEIRQCAFNYAEKNNINHPFIRDKKAAGRDWMERFLNRNPEISVRKPQPTSLNRLTSFNREEITLFFSKLQSVMEKHKFTPTRIFNADETGISNVQVSAKILAQKGQKRVGFTTSGERGRTTTVMCSFSASGIYVPPLFIFARQRMDAQLKRNGPPGAAYACSSNGWINETLFIDWLHHFARFVKSTTDDPVLLVIDNHVSHCTLKAYNFCRENGIVILTIPPHSSHRTQPLDVTFYKPLKTAYNAECDKFLKSRPGERITTYELAEIFNKSFSRIATPDKAIKGFEVTGIFPMNPDVFSDDDFMAAENIKAIQQAQQQEVPNETQNHEATRDQNAALNANQNDEETLDQNSCDGNGSRKRKEDQDEASEVSFRQILNLPSCSNTLPKKMKTSRKKQHAEIFTSTPNKDQLEEKENKKLEKQKNLETRNEKPKFRRVLAVDGLRSNIRISNQSKMTKVVPTPRVKVNRTCKVKISQPNQESSEEFDSDEENDQEINEDVCPVCGEFGKNEIWVRCVVCGQWAHKECINQERKDYICDYCL